MAQTEQSAENSDSDMDKVVSRLMDYLANENNNAEVNVSDETLKSILKYNPFKKTFLYVVTISFVVLSIGGALYCGQVSYYDLTPVNECLVNNFLNELPLSREILHRKSDCKFCRRIYKIVKRQKLSPQEFERKYAYTKRPVVVTDAAKNWSALTQFSFDFLKATFQGKSLNAVAERCQFFPYRSDFDSLDDVFEMPIIRAYNAPDTKPWYVGWSNCHMKAAEALRKHYGRPYFLPPLSEASRVDWIFMGSPGYGAPLHIDDVKLPSWQVQLKGKKLWTLEPPYECRLQCPTNLTVTVNPGEIIVLDTNYWYHGTKIIGDDLSITIGTEYD